MAIAWKPRAAICSPRRAVQSISSCAPWRRPSPGGARRSPRWAWSGPGGHGDRGRSSNRSSEVHPSALRRPREGRPADRQPVRGHGCAGWRWLLSVVCRFRSVGCRRAGIPGTRTAGRAVRIRRRGAAHAGKPWRGSCRRSGGSVPADVGAGGGDAPAAGPRRAWRADGRACAPGGTGIGEVGADGVAVAGRCPGGSSPSPDGVVPFHGHRGKSGGCWRCGTVTPPGSTPSWCSGRPTIRTRPRCRRSPRCAGRSAGT